MNGRLKNIFTPLIFITITITIFTLLSCGKRREKNEVRTPDEFVVDAETNLTFAKNQVLVTIQKEKQNEVEELIKSKGGKIIGIIELGDKIILQVEIIAQTSEEIFAISKQIIDSGLVYNAGPNVVMFPDIFPNDREFDSWDGVAGGNNWHLEAMRFPLAWEIVREGTSKVAVIDFGILVHEDIEFGVGGGGELGIIQEGVGRFPEHGLEVVGVISAIGNNEIGISGVMWRSNLHVYVTDGSVADFISKLVRAAQEGARVINFSGGIDWGKTPSGENEHDRAIIEYQRKIFSVVFEYLVANYDILFVQSAGNDGIDARWNGAGASVKDLFPENIIVVGSIGPDGRISGFSNWGEDVIYAPGEWIITTCGVGYCLRGGTSLSAGLISGLAGLISSLRPDLSAGDIKRAIINSIGSNGIPDAHEALFLASQIVASQRSYISGTTSLSLDIQDSGILFSPQTIECATYDATLSAPKCPQNSSGCSTCYLLNGRDNLTLTSCPTVGSVSPEQNQPNTLNAACADGTGSDNTNHACLSSEEIKIDSLSETGFFTPNSRVKISAKVFCYGQGHPGQNNDFVTIFYNNTLGWSSVKQCTCDVNTNGYISGTCAGEHVLSNVAGNHIFRAKVGHNVDDTTTCESSNALVDHDDLVVPVDNPPSDFSCGSYDAGFKTVVCPADSVWCGTCSLVKCRDDVDGISGKNDNTYEEDVPGLTGCSGSGGEPIGEPNRPNTVFSGCSDGTGDTAEKDEEVRSINVKSLSGGRFEGGQLVEVSFLGYCWSTDNKFNISYASGITTSSSTVNWRYLNTIDCPAGGWHRMRYTFRLDNVEGYHAVRVNEYFSTTIQSTCVGAGQTNGHEDVDDIVFYVKSVPPSALPVCAQYDPGYMAPKCPAGARECSTCDLVMSRDNIAGKAEPNQPNTLGGSCPDETDGTYLTDETVERVEIKSLDPSGTFQPESQAEVLAVVYCWPGGYYSDNIKIIYTENADLPSWQTVLTSACPGPGWQTFKKAFTLGKKVGNHAVRVIFKLGSFPTAETCGTSDGTPGGAGYADNDDLVFLVGVPRAPQNFNAEGVFPDTITLSWNDVQGETRYEIRVTDTFDNSPGSWYELDLNVPQDRTWYIHRPLPEGAERCYALRSCNGNGCSAWVTDCATIPSLQANCAVYNSTWKVPECAGGVNNCSTCDLIKSQDSLPSKQEINTSNTWFDSCADSGAPPPQDYFSGANSIEKIVLTTSEPTFSPGFQINVTAYVYCSGSGVPVQLYVSEGTTPVSFGPAVGSGTCPGEGVNSFNFTYTPASDNLYVFRVTAGVNPSSSTCPTASNTEVDDVVVRVGGVPQAPTNFDVTFVQPNIARVTWTDVANETYYELVSAPTATDQFTQDTDCGCGLDSSSHDHGGLGEGDTICFKLRACNAIGCSAFVGPRCTTRSPTAPSSVTAYTFEGSGQTLTFLDNSTNEDGFAIDRTSDGVNWTRYEWWSTSATQSGTGSLSITFLLGSQDWCFRVASFKQVPGSGTLSLSAWADGVSVCVPRAPSTLRAYSTTTKSTLSLRWFDLSSLEENYGIEYRLSSSPTWTLDGPYFPNTSVTQIVFPLEDIYCMRVKSTASGGMGISYSSEVCKSSIASPSPLYVDETGGGVLLRWQDSATTETGFRVEYSSDGGSTWNLVVIANPNQTTYAHSGNNCYRVRTEKDTQFSDWTNISCFSGGGSVCSLVKQVSLGNEAIRHVLSSGNVAYVAFGTSVSAVNEFSGAVIWSAQVASVVTAMCDYSADYIFVGTANGLYLLSKLDGGTAVFRTFSDTPTGCAVYGGYIYVTTNNGKIFNLTNTFSTVVSHVISGVNIESSPAVDELNKVLVVTANDGNLRIFDLSLNLKQVISATASAIRSSPALGPSGQIFFGADDGKVYGVRRENIGSGNYVLYLTSTVGGQIVASPVVYTYGSGVTVVVISKTGVLAAIDGTKEGDGISPEWSYSIGGTDISPALSGGSVFVGVGNTLYRKNLGDSSSPSPCITVGGSISSSVVIDGKNVVFGDSQGSLYVVSSDTGEAVSSWIDFTMKGKRVGGGHMNRGFLYEEMRICPGVGSGYLYMPSVTDVDGDGDFDIVMGYAFGAESGKVYAVELTTRNLLWNAPTGGAIWSTPAFGDVNGDSVMDVVIGNDGGWVVVLNGATGAQVGSIQLCDRVRAVSLANLDADPQYEIVAVAQVCNKVYVIDWNGGLNGVAYDLQVGSDNNSYAVVANIGATQYIVVTDKEGRVYRINYSSGVTESIQVPSGQTQLGTPAVADIDSDGEYEFVFGSTESRIYVGSLNTFSLEATIDTGLVGQCVRGPTFANVDGDSFLEIFVVAGSCTNTGKSWVIMVDVGGSPVSYQVSWKKEVNAVSTSVPVIGDFDDDGAVELLTLHDNGYLYVWELDGVLSFAAPYFATNTQYGVRGSPVILDVDGDGALNVVFGDMLGRCGRIFEFGAGTAAGKIWWRYYRLNAQQNAFIPIIP